MRLWKTVLAFALALFAWPARLAAQCPAPDGLDGGPCCAQANAQLPVFPNFKQRALEICWRDCNVNSTVAYIATWKLVIVKPGTIGGGGVVPCGEFSMQLDLRDPTGVLQWSGVLRFQYSRTWSEVAPTGTPLQVWRYLLNGDLIPVAPFASPCPIPICAAATANRVRFTGYMDCATDCSSPAIMWEHAWMLTHACDTIDHAPGFPRAGVFHPDRSYSIVGPSIGFVPAPLQPLEGTPASPLEAMRRRVFGLPPVVAVTCDFEERAIFTLAQISQFCLCGLPPTQQFLLGNLNVNGSCGSTVTTPGGPLLPGFMSMGIGSWTIPANFPGVENVRWTTGNYNWFDGCTGVLSNEVFFGATTIGGYPASQVLSTGVVGILPPTFIDQSSSMRAPNAVATTMNIPYVSNHFLNLNH